MVAFIVIWSQAQLSGRTVFTVIWSQAQFLGRAIFSYLYICFLISHIDSGFSCPITCAFFISLNFVISSGSDSHDFVMLTTLSLV